MRSILILFVILGSVSLSVTAAAQVRKAISPAVGTAAALPRTVDIVGGDDMKYSLTTIRARPGESLRIRLVSRGTVPKVAMAHNVVILKPGTDVVKFVNEGAAFRDSDFIAPALKDAVIAKTAFAGPGETVDVVLKVPTGPGSYPYICTFAGHCLAGMKGTLIVK
jgi:azurin